MRTSNRELSVYFLTILIVDLTSLLGQQPVELSLITGVLPGFFCSSSLIFLFVLLSIILVHKSILYRWLSDYEKSPLTIGARRRGTDYPHLTNVLRGPLWNNGQRRRRQRFQIQSRPARWRVRGRHCARYSRRCYGNVGQSTTIAGIRRFPPTSEEIAQRFRASLQ